MWGKNFIPLCVCVSLFSRWLGMRVTCKCVVRTIYISFCQPGPDRRSSFPIFQETGNLAILNHLPPHPSSFAHTIAQLTNISVSQTWVPPQLYTGCLLCSLQSSNFTLGLVYSFHMSKLSSKSLPPGSLRWCPCQMLRALLLIDAHGLQSLSCSSSPPDVELGKGERFYSPVSPSPSPHQPLADVCWMNKWVNRGIHQFYSLLSTSHTYIHSLNE